MNNNIILTGPPRSGTTLACFLLNKVDNTIALHEPMNLQMFANKITGIKSIHTFFDEMRTSLIESGTAISKVKDGSIPDNPFGETSDTNRKSLVSKNRVHFDKQLNNNFNLIIKHNGHFTYLIPELESIYPMFVIIRNPVATIASWNSVNAPVSDGNLKVLQFLNPQLYEELERIPDIIVKQVTLLNSMYDLYTKSSKLTVISYEDIISSKGKALSAITTAAMDLNEPLQNKNSNPLYNNSLVAKIKDTLLNMQGSFLNYYAEESIKAY